MRYGQDPNFRFTLARSIYKSVLRFISRTHEIEYTVAPLTPSHPRVAFTNQSKGEVRLSWQPVNDPQEPTASPQGYVVYTAKGSGGFDNGTHTHSPHFSLRLEPGVLYSFRVAAVNQGGESFPSEVMSALFQPKSKATVLVVNGFHRLSSPAIIDTDTEQGFLLDDDIGVSYGRTAGFTGRQLYFDKDKMGSLDSIGLGFGFTELAGRFIGGNEFNYVRTHAEAIRQAGGYSIASCASEALGQTDRKAYQVADVILGLERDDGHSLVRYKSLTPAMQAWLSDFAKQGGRLLVSGSYVGSDMTADDERLFLSRVLKCRYGGKATGDRENVNGMGMNFKFFRRLNEQHYAAQHPDILQAEGKAMATMAYADGYGAAVAYGGSDYRCFTMGFPFECIQSAAVRASIMKGILTYLINNN
jgi:hypothetical protein